MDIELPEQQRLKIVQQSGLLNAGTALYLQGVKVGSIFVMDTMSDIQIVGERKRINYYKRQQPMYLLYCNSSHPSPQYLPSSHFIHLLLPVLSQLV